MKRVTATLAICAFVAASCAQSTQRAQPRPSPRTPTVQPSSPDQTVSPTIPAPPSSPGRPTTPARPPAPSGALPDWLRGVDATALPTTKRVVALTFDAGANADAAQSILATLRNEGVPATFFLTGAWARAHPGLATAIAARYPIGNHTFDHPDLTLLHEAAAKDQIRRGAAAIEAVAGRPPEALFRFPFGASNAPLIGIANGLGYACFRWTVDTLGWKGRSGGSAADVVDRVMRSLRPGAIVLMHVGSNPDDHSMLDAEALPALIDALRAHGYGFTTLDRWR